LLIPSVMKNTIQIKKAGKHDFEAICVLLAAENLPTSDLNPALDNFFIAIKGDAITGVIGMDKYGTDGLLRSAVVHKDYRNTGIAGSLVNQLFDYAKEQGVTSLYLITNTAEEYFKIKGFIKIAKENVPATVLQSKEFNGLCPASSVIMVRR